METGQPVDEQVHKKGRHRKKHLYNAILQQMEFYFSDSNLTKDRFLSQLTQTDPYVDILVFLKCNKIRKLTTSTEDITKAIRKSELLELSEDSTKVRRKTPVKIKDNVEECTIYVEKIKADATHDWLSSVFSEFGNVVYVSIPKYRHNKVNKGFGFVEFETEAEAKQAVEFFESIGCKMSSQISPEELCSIATYEGDAAKEQPTPAKEQDANSDSDSINSKKRKHSEEREIENKKLKTDESVENTESEESEDKKKKKSKKLKKKAHLKELGLQILSKLEWKKMRNRYLDMQKKKMKQLKQFLNKRKFNNRLEDYKQKTYVETDDSQNTVKENNETKEPKLEFVAGVIVKAELPEPCYEIKKAKNEIRTYSSEIKYIEFPLVSGSEEVYIRFSDNENAKKFCSSEFNGKCKILENEEEKLYWEKIQNDRSVKFKKEHKKQRGRDKLLKRAEKELGKHIRFDDD